MTPPTGRHPDQADLALFSTFDLPLLQRWVVRRHLRGCSECRFQVEQFRDSLSRLRNYARDAAAVIDTRLEREMIGNIKVGLAAAECIANASPRRVRPWSMLALAGTLSAVFITGWLINMPRQDTDRILNSLHGALNGSAARGGTVLRTTAAGVSVRSQGGTLTLLHPSAAASTAVFTSNSSVSVRYVDGETGQVTITNVYGQ